MIDRHALLSDLQVVLKELEADLLERSESSDVPDVSRTLRAEYDRAQQAHRTAEGYEEWRSDAITQAAAAWVLSCVFVRFLEDNRLIDPPKIAGPGERLKQARDEHELYFRSHATHTDRDYLLAYFDQLVKLPGGREIFGEHNPVRELPNWLSGDAAGELLMFFQQINADTGTLVHDFADSPSSNGNGWDTRFLGDLYQDLSEAARKKYALLQTPEFVEEFILDRTLDPAIDEFGVETNLGLRTSTLEDVAVSDASLSPKSQALITSFKMIDPACGSGHFLLGGFRRILDRWQRKEPGTNVRELVQRTLDSIYGVDVNPYAVAIARFRMLLAAMRSCGITRLADAPAFHFNLACGDSLLHAPLRHGGDAAVAPLFAVHDVPDCPHAYASEDLPVLRRILAEGQYHAVVANPPYITPKDRALNKAYRKRYRTCHKQYSLAVPFLERIFRLAVAGGYTGQITANSFMFNEFGKKLIREFIPTIDLTHVIDTSLAYIPHHGTPTVILFGKSQRPVMSQVRAAYGLQRENGEPEVAAKGQVWVAIVGLIDQPGSQNLFLSVEDVPRHQFEIHPWVLGGGAVSGLKSQLEASHSVPLSSLVQEIGRTTHTGCDETFEFSPASAYTRKLRSHCVPFLTGDNVRNYVASPDCVVLFPYDHETGEPLGSCPVELARQLWPHRTILRRREDFGNAIEARGLAWYGHSMFFPRRYAATHSITFPCVSTHNHFVPMGKGSVSNPHAPRVFLEAQNALQLDAIAIILNTSTAGFWMRQVMRDKGGGGIGGGIAAEAWERFFEYVAAKLVGCPICVARPDGKLTALASLGADFTKSQPMEIVRQRTDPLTNVALEQAERSFHDLRRHLILLQEEADWWGYWAYGLSEQRLTLSNLPSGIELGQRSFEIVLARKMTAGETQTTWFERHGSSPITELPTEWPDDYRQLVERRIALIERDPNIRLIEQPEYKRRWNTEVWDSQLESALREWLLDRLESYFDFDGRMNDEDRPTAQLNIALVSIAKLADVARQDVEFLRVGELYRDDQAFDVQTLVAELIEAESVPLLPSLRYKPNGLRKRVEWEQMWALQRAEDAFEAELKSEFQVHGIDVDDSAEVSYHRMPWQSLAMMTESNEEEVKVLFPFQESFKWWEVRNAILEKLVGKISAPPKYASADFLKSDYWRLRGKLDVPKELWISFPHCEGPDGTPVIAWAGYNHLQLATAIGQYYQRVKDEFGGSDDSRLVPLLACLIELLPWLKQWHNQVNPEYGVTMGDYFEGFLQEESRQMAKTFEEIKAWTPPAKTSGAGRRRVNT